MRFGASGIDAQFQPQMMQDVQGAPYFERRLARLEFRHEAHPDSAQPGEFGLGQSQLPPLPTSGAAYLLEACSHEIK